MIDVRAIYRRQRRRRQIVEAFKYTLAVTFCLVVLSWLLLLPNP
jgi:hypothetical protein